MSKGKKGQEVKREGSDGGGGGRVSHTFIKTYEKPFQHTYIKNIGSGVLNSGAVFLRFVTEAFLRCGGP